jgi:hypothetical protein
MIMPGIPNIIIAEASVISLLVLFVIGVNDTDGKTMIYIFV